MTSNIQSINPIKAISIGVSSVSVVDQVEKRFSCSTSENGDGQVILDGSGFDGNPEELADLAEILKPQDIDQFSELIGNIDQIIIFA